MDSIVSAIVSELNDKKFISYDTIDEALVSLSTYNRLTKKQQYDILYNKAVRSYCTFSGLVPTIKTLAHNKEERRILECAIKAKYNYHYTIESPISYEVRDDLNMVLETFRLYKELDK